ncbi:MAG: hypothetical protein RJA34_2728 [Pseudomonadota bacterium]|jgi:hypothetical protein
MISGVTGSVSLGAMGYSGASSPGVSAVSASELANARRAADTAEAKARALRREATQAQRDADDQRRDSDALETKKQNDEQSSLAYQLNVRRYGGMQQTGRLLNTIA